MIIKRVLERRVKVGGCLVSIDIEGYIISDSTLTIREINGIESFAKDVYYQLPSVIAFMGDIDFTTRNNLNLCPEIEYFLWKIHSQYVEDKVGCYNMMKYMYKSCSRWFQSEISREDRSLIHHAKESNGGIKNG